MSTVGKTFLAIFLTVLGGAMIILTLYILHRKGIIEVRIPRPCRIYCFKNYLSPEEKAEIAEIQRQIKAREVQKELNLRMAQKPEAEGYKIDDSFFSKNYASPSEEDNGQEFEEYSESDPKDSGPQSPEEEAAENQQNDSAAVASGSAKSNF